MISWIQKSFQHHFRWVFALVLLATIISFIIAFGPGSTVGRGIAGRNAVNRQFFSYDLGSQEGEARLFGDANVSATLLTGSGNLESNALQNYALQRAAALSVADSMHVPATTNEEIADHIKKLGAFAGANGEFDPQRYDAFRTSLKAGSRVTEADVHRILADDVRAEKVKKIIGGPGYVQAADVKSALDTFDAVWSLGVATVDYASFKPEIPVTDLALTKFFEENSFRYTIPARVVVSAANFPASAYVGKVDVNETEVRAYYSANPARWPNPSAKPGAKPDAAADFAAVRPQVEAALKLEKAQRIAIKVASDLSYALYTDKVALNTPAFDALMAAQHLTPQPLAPFTRDEGPAELGNSPEIANEAFKLGEGHAYSDALAAPNGAVVLFWKETLPPKQPLLAEVRAKVVADYTENEKSKRFIETGKLIRSQLEARLKAGDTFEQAAAAAAAATHTKIEAKILAPFTRRAPLKDLDNSVAGALGRLEKGKVSDMIRRENGVLIYVVDKKSPDLSETGPAYAMMRAQLAADNARIGASSYLAELVAQELKKTEAPAK